jgi:transposase
VLMLTPGNINDMLMAEALFAAARPFRRLVADRGYDTNRVRELIAARGALAVIPSTAARRSPIPYDKDIYRSRNLIERMWGRLKDWRRLATRYDKLADNFLSTAAIAAAVTYWIN